MESVMKEMENEKRRLGGNLDTRAALKLGIFCSKAKRIKSHITRINNFWHLFPAMSPGKEGTQTSKCGGSFHVCPEQETSCF